MDLSSLCLVIEDIVSGLPGCRRLIDKSHIGHDIFERGDEIDLSSHISEVVDYVHILVLECPVLGQGDLHLLEIETILPMYLVFVAGDHRDSPGVPRIDLGSEWEFRVLRLIQEVVFIGDIVHLSNDRIIDADDLHIHDPKDVIRNLVLVYDSADLNGRVAKQSIIHSHVNFAFGHLIVLPVSSGPTFSSKAGQ